MKALLQIWESERWPNWFCAPATILLSFVGWVIALDGLGVL